MFRSFTVILQKITNWKIIALFVVSFFVVHTFPWHFIPDYLKFGHKEGKKELVFRLLGTTIGFSGIMLTLLLVSYNFYVKTIRRFTLEFITDNRWLQFIFSLFFGMVIFLGLGYLFIESAHSVNDTTILYCSYVLTILFILSLFPLSILALNESVSLNRIHKILNKLSESDFEQLYASHLHGRHSIEEIEKNPILILKDLCITAINDKDWVLPQTILNKLHELLIIPLHSKSSVYDVQKSTFIWASFCNHLKKEIVKHNDLAAGQALLYLTLNTYTHFAEKKIIHIRGNKIDDFLKDYLRLIIEQNAFGEIQSYFSRYLSDILKEQFDSINYSDEEIVTDEYRFECKDKLLDYKLTALDNLWFYLTKELPDILFDTVYTAIDCRRKSVYDTAFWSIQFTFDAIFSSENLTKCQKRNAIKELLFKADNISDYAIKHGILDKINCVTYSQVETWFVQDYHIGYEAFHAFKRMINKLIQNGELSDIYIDNYFMIGRILCGRTIEESILNYVVAEILKMGILLVENEKTEMPIKRALLYQLNWFQSAYFNRYESLLPTKQKYNNRITELLKRFKDEVPFF